jgi:hypothetical protein
VARGRGPGAAGEGDDALRELIPADGTSLENAFRYLQTLSPVPDNIFLITDGLPTQGAEAPRGSKVSGNQRQRLFRQAVRAAAGERAGEHHPRAHGGRPAGGLGVLAAGADHARLLHESLERLALGGGGMRRRREMAEFSLSFLDVICCGFGAVILLLMITKTVQPQIIEASTVNLEGLVADLQEQLFEIRGETRVLNRDLTARQEQLSEYEERIAILRGQLAAARSRYDSLQVETNSNAVITEQLAIARQSLTAEMKRLLAGLEVRNNLIGGIPWTASTSSSLSTPPAPCSPTPGSA